MKIFALKMLSMKIFFLILFVWQETNPVFNSEFEKIAFYKTTTSATHTHIKIQHAKGSINGSQGKGINIFYKTIKLV